MEAIKPSPRAQREHPILPPRFRASTGPVPRSLTTTQRLPSLTPQLFGKRGSSIIVNSVPFCVNRWDRPRDEAQRGRSGASTGSDLTFPSRAARTPHPPSKLPCERRTGPAEPRRNPTTALTPRLFGKKDPSIIVKSVPFCVNRWDRPRDYGLAEPPRRSKPQEPVPKMNPQEPVPKMNPRVCP